LAAGDAVHVPAGFPAGVVVDVVLVAKVAEEAALDRHGRAHRQSLSEHWLLERACNVTFLQLMQEQKNSGGLSCQYRQPLKTMNDL